MTTYELHEQLDRRPARARPRIGLSRVVAALLQRSQRRRTIERLAYLDAHQLADVGLEPGDVADALAGDDQVLWDKIRRHNG